MFSKYNLVIPKNRNTSMGADDFSESFSDFLSLCDWVLSLINFKIDDDPDLYFKPITMATQVSIIEI
jgi:hypothetical protein